MKYTPWSLAFRNITTEICLPRRTFGTSAGYVVGVVPPDTVHVTHTSKGLELVASAKVPPGYLGVVTVTVTTH
eukprot:1176646-Prorocentrum_minimum.AAC.1